jgi:RNA polymerase sigma factor (sigma-70 family)
MAGESVRAGVLTQLGTILRFGVVGDLSDSQLLHRFLNGRDGAEQAAFSALVERHGPMVLSVCRQVLGNSHDSQDAFQATFLVMAQKAASVQNGDSLASWLHGIALRVATRARADEARRRMHERRCATMKEKERDNEGVRSEPCPELHEEIARLPQRYREPVVLCYLEGLSSEQAAVRIGCAPGTIWSRLSRARERLRGRLVRRGVAVPAAVLSVGLMPPASAALPATLLEVTVRASLGFAGRRATEATLASAPAVTLARGVIYAMTISKLKTLGTAALACALALGGARTLTSGQPGGLEARQAPAAAVAESDDGQAALSRSVDKLESALDETARRNAEMRKDLQSIRAGLKALSDLPRPVAVTQRADEFADVLKQQPAQAVARLVEQLKRKPVQPKTAPYRVGLYMMDVSNGEVTLVADQPAPGLTHSGSAVWSHDGRRILFDATPGTQWSLSRLQSIEIREGRVTVTDIGTGNCPTFSPADDRITFLSNADGAENGVWLMNADGSDRRLLGDYGKPIWSPDGRQLLIMSFTFPRQVTLMDANPEKSGVLQIPDHQIHSDPSWAGKETILAAIGPTKADTVALIDVSDPHRVKVKEVLWRKANGPDVEPDYPIYSPATGQCIFVGIEAKGEALYSVQPNKAGPAKPLGPEGFEPKITGLAYSPDGRYVLYSVRGPGPKVGVSAIPQGTRN